ncbi:DUF6308 family protein [Streptomyces bobili]|uniref:DUF6308 family protein n=1 Tax=Streptomyces bobili TaxID=67280 RepID=UPI0037BB050B
MLHKPVFGQVGARERSCLLIGVRSGARHRPCGRDHQPGIGWVTAGKLLARKRPRLLPVYDQAVRCILGRPKSFWLDLRGALRADNHALHRELMVLRQAADIPASVSALRVCDVVPWMHHRTDHQQRSCIGT